MFLFKIRVVDMNSKFVVILYHILIFYNVLYSKLLLVHGIPSLGIKTN